jgi:hypothetical protein
MPFTISFERQRTAIEPPHPTGKAGKIPRHSQIASAAFILRGRRKILNPRQGG